MKSKLIQNYVFRNKNIESYHTEECDNQVQHWVYAKDGYVFEESGCISICGFDIRPLLKGIKTIIKQEAVHEEIN